MDDFFERYRRQIDFAPFGIEGQRRLTNSRALIVGAGGLGSWFAEILVRCGIGFLRICDDDTVELSNLHRQSLYRLEDVRQKRQKVEAARDYLLSIRPECYIDIKPFRADRLTLPALVKDIHLIIDGTDTFQTRFVINDIAYKLGIPWLFCGVAQAQGQTAFFIPPFTPCLRCILPNLPSCTTSDSNPCQQNGVIGAAVASIASIAAMEAIKFLSGNQDLVSPYLLFLNFWDNTCKRFRLSDLKSQQVCPCCQLKEFEYLEP